MNPKPRPNHARYIRTLRKMTPEERLVKAFELSGFSKRLFLHGLRKRFADVTESEFERILKERLDKCHNRKYKQELSVHENLAGLRSAVRRPGS